jgi:hypothetical protein
MPDKKTRQRAARDRRQGKAPSTQAGEFVREEIHHVREGKHGARSPEQAIAIGLSKARRAGVHLPPPPGGKERKQRARRDSAKARRRSKPSRRRSRGVRKALAHEGHRSASRGSLARHARKAARNRSASARSAAARKAARTRARRK